MERLAAKTTPVLLLGAPIISASVLDSVARCADGWISRLGAVKVSKSNVLVSMVRGAYEAPGPASNSIQMETAASTTVETVT